MPRHQEYPYQVQNTLALGTKERNAQNALASTAYEASTFTPDVQTGIGGGTTIAQNNDNQTAYANLDVSQYPDNWRGGMQDAGGSGGAFDGRGNIHQNMSLGTAKQVFGTLPGGGPRSAEQIIAEWVRQNTHADNYRTNPEYASEWDDSHGNSTSNISSAISNSAQAFATAAAAGYGLSALGAGGLASGSAGAAGAGAGSTIGGAGTLAPGAVNATSIAGSGLTAGGATSAGLGAAGATGLGASVHGVGSSLTPIGTAGAGTSVGVGAVGSNLSNLGTPTGPAPPNGGVNIPNGLTGSNALDNLLIGGSSLVSGYLSNEATNNAMDEIGRQYDQTREDMEPWRLAGVGALNQLQNFDINSVRDDPLYQLSEGRALQAVNRGNSARGLNLSGNALIDEAQTAADVSSGFGNNQWNRLAGLAGVGQTTAAQLGQFGSNAANNLAGLQVQQGEGINNAIQGGLNNYLLNNYLRR